MTRLSSETHGRAPTDEGEAFRKRENVWSKRPLRKTPPAILCARWEFLVHLRAWGRHSCLPPESKTAARLLTAAGAAWMKWRNADIISIGERTSIAPRN